jgi:hypothetical protein
MTLKKLLAQNDNANPEFVLPFVFMSLFMGVVFTGTAIVLASQGGHQIALPVISGLAALSWASLALLMHKYSRITM